MTCCDATISLVQRIQATLTCMVCGERYWYAPETDTERLPPPPCEPMAARPHRATMPGPAPDRRISVVREPRLSDTPLPNAKGRAPVPDDGDGELVTVDRLASLLDELQVDLRTSRIPGDPSPPAAPDGPSAGGVDWGADRVQTSPRWYGATLSSPALPGVDVLDTLRQRTGGRGEAYDVLLWLRCESRATGDALRAGGPALLREVLGALGYRFAPEEIRARFDASREALDLGAPIRGRWHVDVAMRAWWQLPVEGGLTIAGRGP